MTSDNTVICPLSVQVSKRKKFILNINNYRNLGYHTLSKAKREYFQAVKLQVLKLRGWQRVAVRFTMYPKTARRIDLSNVLSIHDKFLLDTAVTLGKLDDDDYHHVIKVSYHFGEIDRMNSRVEAEFIDMDL